MAEISPNWNALYSNQGLRLTGNAGLDALNQRYAQVQQQKANDEKLFGDAMSKMNFGGARPPELPDLQKQYQGILDTHAQIRSTNNPTKQAQLMMQQRQQMAGLMYDVQQSKERHAQELKLAELPNNPNVNLADGFHEGLHGVLDAPKDKWLDSYNKLQGNLFQPSSDLGSISDKAFNAVKDDGKRSGAPVWDSKVGEFKTPTISYTTADKNAFRSNLQQQLKPQDMKRIAQLYPAPTFAESFQKYAEDAWNQHAGKIGEETTYSQPYESFGQKITMAETNARLRQKYGQQAQTNAPTYFQDLSERMRTGVKGSGEEFAQQVKQNPAYRGQPVQYDLNNPKSVKIAIPTQYKYEPKNQDADDKGFVVVKPGYTTVLDSTNPDQWAAGFAKIYKDVTGDASAIPSKSMTPYGKGHVPGGQSYENAKGKISPQDFNAKWAKLPKGGTLIGPDGVEYTKK